MSINSREVFDSFYELSTAEARDIAIGTVEMPEEFRDIEVIDLGQIGKEEDFEEPGLHKRVRAGIGALISRSMDNVAIDYSSTVHQTPGHYYDYDRTLEAKLTTFCSSWGSDRSATAHIADTYHVTNSGTIEKHYAPQYAEQDFMLGLISDSEGTPSVIGRLVIPKPDEIYYYDDRFEDIHTEVERMHKSLTSHVYGYIVEDALRGIDR